MGRQPWRASGPSRSSIPIWPQRSRRVRRARVDIAAWTPVWIGVDLVVFLGLGIFLRCEQGRKQ